MVRRVERGADLWRRLRALGTGSPSGHVREGYQRSLIRASIDDKYSVSMKLTAHLDHISHCKTACGPISRIDGPTQY